MYRITLKLKKSKIKFSVLKKTIFNVPTQQTGFKLWLNSSILSYKSPLSNPFFNFSGFYYLSLTSRFFILFQKNCIQKKSFETKFQEEPTSFDWSSNTRLGNLNFCQPRGQNDWRRFGNWKFNKLRRVYSNKNNIVASSSATKSQTDGSKLTGYCEIVSKIIRSIKIFFPHECCTWHMETILRV